MNGMEPKDSILGILKSAIDIEKFGIRYYSALSTAVTSETAKSLFVYLKDAEEKHQRTLEDMFDTQKGLGDEVLKQLPLDNLSEEGRLEIFSVDLDEVDPSSIDTKDALNYGIMIEEKSKRFYNNAAQVVDNIELKETFQKLVDFEDDHLRVLQKNLEEFERTGNWCGYVATE
jgi:rubrerythrin